VGTRWTTPGRRDEILEAGCRALGWHVEPLPRNVTDCLEGVECGYCGYGCRHGKKNTTTERYLRDAVAHGARVIPECDVDRVTIENGRATGVVARVRGEDGETRRLTVRADRVIVAAGAVYTPAILARSGLRNKRIGRGLKLHPATAVLGVFPDRVDPWSGTLQTRYSDEFADQDGGYGTKFETAPAHFALAASAFGWGSARDSKEDIGRLGYTSLVGILLRDRDPGRVVVGRDGHPRVHYELSGFDAAHVRTGVRAAAQLLAVMGATEVFSLQTPPARAQPGAAGWLDRFMASVDRIGYRYCRMSYITFHQMASAAMGADPRRSVVGPDGATHEIANLYVTDGSAFPTSSGVNPMLTIMAIADYVARGMR
jgi:choline dehydrogenase-like flavoprotein